MLCLNSEIEIALKNDSELIGLLGGELIYELFEAGDRNISYPRVIFEEISNVPAFSNDNIEKISRITYRVSVCAETKLIETINAVERVMVSINFVRHSSESIRNLPLGVSGKTINFIKLGECI